MNFLKTNKTIILLLMMSFLFSSCQYIPENVKAVDNFEQERYLGKWYEIARFDFKFEKDLNNTTAEYSLNDNGTIKVVNKGYNYVKEKWQEAEGKAKFRDKSDVAALKVSFFGPFYAGYNVIALDEDYQYALVCGGNKDYLWILSRTTTIPLEIKNSYLEKAAALGFEINNLIWVEHGN